MKNFSKILFPVDLSEISQKMVPYVKTLGEKFDAEIHVLFVARVFEHFSSMYVTEDSIQSFQDEILKGAKKRLEEFRQEHFSGFSKIKTAVKLGDIPEVILNYIRTAEIDLLIMGTHGRKGLDKIFFGSIAERVSKAATVPVLLINPYRIKP